MRENNTLPFGYYYKIFFFYPTLFYYYYLFVFFIYIKVPTENIKKVKNKKFSAFYALKKRNIKLLSYNRYFD